MSQQQGLYPYFDEPASPTFPGEVPPPGPVGDNNVGLSSLKANADHGHDIELGGETNLWQSALFVPPWVNFGGTARPCQYTRIGGIAFLRGVATYPAGVPSAYQTMFTIGVDYCPRNGMRETFPALCNMGAMELDINADGRVTVATYVGATYHMWGTIMWSID